jgi:hypothetical protein
MCVCVCVCARACVVSHPVQELAAAHSTAAGHTVIGSACRMQFEHTSAAGRTALGPALANEGRPAAMCTFSRRKTGVLLPALLLGCYHPDSSDTAGSSS